MDCKPSHLSPILSLSVHFLSAFSYISFTSFSPHISSLTGTFSPSLTFSIHPFPSAKLPHTIPFTNSSFILTSSPHRLVSPHITTELLNVDLFFLFSRVWPMCFVLGPVFQCPVLSTLLILSSLFFAFFFYCFSFLSGSYCMFCVP